MNDLLLRACRREVVPRPPVWLMRQAGRYLPEYRAIRARHQFLEMVTTPKLAAEVTVQPVRRLGVDAAIVFSDIMILPQAMGMDLVFEDGVGPRFREPLRDEAPLERLRDPDPARDLGFVLEAIQRSREILAHEVPVVGFAGAPWTLASYMIEGGGSKQFSHAKRALMQSPEWAHALLDRLATGVGALLKAQVEAGAGVVQIFDSWAGVLSPSDYRTFGLPYLAKSVRIAATAGAPVIVFALGAGWALEELARDTGAAVIGIDWHTEAASARRRLDGEEVALQGNFDPSWLYAPVPVIESRVRTMLEAFGSRGYIANLGHGILPDVPVEHVQAFVDAVKAVGGD